MPGPIRIKASFKRVIQCKPYEPETIELGVEDEVILNVPESQRKAAIAKLTAEYFNALAQVGDDIVQKRLKG